ncbi:hypothetical protein JTE90_025683 [Oedothorax gibbosus]|uniref:OAR domain-containing protein n=1 Tax=Oedothorax gibbosus TaxID=931172 RepID=A0AAV6UCG9_9ARAC|nr:hypothetical protein JTE90_025683 [Oedothorax gibbosus]
MEFLWILQPSSEIKGKTSKASVSLQANDNVWFQNRRAKWKKRKKTTNVFRNPGALLPSHSLPPFGSMSDGFCSFGPAAPHDSPRWPQMGPPLGPASSLSRQHSAAAAAAAAMGGINQYMSVQVSSQLVPNSLPSITTSAPAVYQPPYAPAPATPPPSPACALAEGSDVWRGTSIAALRRKALEHTASMFR